MKVDCMYRLAPYGELIRSRYDTEYGYIEGLSLDVFNLIIDPSMWCVRNYVEKDGIIEPRFAEWYMQEEYDCCMCIEINYLGFLAIGFTGTVQQVYHYHDKRAFQFLIQDAIIKRDFYHIGWRPTRVLQYSHAPYIWRFLADGFGNVWAGSGHYKLENSSIDSYDTPPKSFGGYLDCVNTPSAFGVVHRDGIPRNLFISNDGILTERG